MDANRAGDERGEHVLDSVVEDFKVTRHDGRVHRVDHLGLRLRRGKGGEVALHAVNDEEGAGSGVHCGHELRAVKLLHAKGLQVVEAPIVLVLTEDGNGRLGAILVRCRHV